MEWHTRPLRSTFVAYNLFSAIAATQQRLTQVEAIEHFRQLTEREIVMLTFMETNTRPRIIMAMTSESIIVAICGAQNLAHFSGLLAGYWAGTSASGTFNSNDFPVDDALAMYEEIHNFDPNDTTPVLIGGYSYGGVLAAVLAHKCHQENGARKVVLHTFGSPKPGNQELASYLNTFSESQVRWITNNDPVAYVPPNAIQAPELHTLITTQASVNASNYVHLGGAVEIAPDGHTTSPVTFASQTSGDQTQAILSWMSGAEGWNTSGHHWTTYKQRLFFAKELYPDIASDATPHGTALQQQASTTPQEALEPPIIPQNVPPAAPGQVAAPIADLPFKPGVAAGAGRRRVVRWNGCELFKVKSAKQARNARNILKRLRTLTRKALEFDPELIDDAARLQVQLDAAGKESTID